MTAKLSEDQRRALNERPGRPLKIEDDQTHRVYFIVDHEEFAQLIDEELRRELQIGFDQADRGELTTWEPERIKAEGRRQLAGKPPRG